MKRIALVLTLLMAFGFYAVAQDEGTPITVTGSLSFTVGSDTQPDTPNLPVISTAKAATAAMTISSADEKVSATIGLNLLADPSLGGDVEAEIANELARDDFQGTGALGSVLASIIPGYSGFAYTDSASEYLAWLAIEDYVAFFNDAFDDEDASEEGIFEAADLTAFEIVLNTMVSTTADIADVNDDADGIDLFTPIEIGGTAVAADDEFAWTDAIGNEILASHMATVVNAVDVLVNEAIDTIMKDASNDAVNTTVSLIDGWETGADGCVSGLSDFITTLTDVKVDALTDGDKDLITEAVDYYVAYQAAVLTDFNIAVDNTLALTASSFISSASITLKEIGGVVDLTADMIGGHAAVGAINLDTSGHQDEAVGSYPSIGLSLSSGVVDGLSAGLTFYSDDNDAADQIDEVADEWYTWLGEFAAEEAAVDPKLGLGVDLGYTMAISDDMSVGATAGIGMYDLAGGEDMEFGFTVAPSFSGFGAAVGIQFDYGLGIMGFGVDASYAIMGITPSVYFDYVSNNADDELVMAFVTDDEYGTGMAAVKGEGGIALGLDVSVDVGQFIGMAATVGGGFDYSGPTDGDAIIAWDANLSITPLSIDLLSLTVAGGIGDVGIWLGTKEAIMGWNADLTVNIIPANIAVTGGINQGYLANDDDEATQKFGWNAGVTYTHSIASIAAAIGSGWDAADDEDYVSWSIVTSVSF